MGRTRMLKPEFFSDSRVVRCSPLARLFFAGSWCFADDNGILPDDMLQLKMQVLPGDNVDGEALKCELVQSGLWVPFMADDKPWLLIRNFRRHQPLDRPSPSYPLPDERTLADLEYSVGEISYSARGKDCTARVLCDERTAAVRRTDGVQTADVRRTNGGCTAGVRRTDDVCTAAVRPSKGKGNGNGKGKGTVSSARASEDSPVNAVPDFPAATAMEFVTSWNALGAPFAHVQSLGPRVNALAACWGDAFWRDNWVAALRRMAACAFCRGGGPRGWVADVGWFLKGPTVHELMEGKYDDRPAGGGTGMNEKTRGEDEW